MFRLTKKAINRAIAKLNTISFQIVKKKSMNSMIHNLLLHFKALHEINYIFKSQLKKLGKEQYLK